MGVERLEMKEGVGGWKELMREREKKRGRERE